MTRIITVSLCVFFVFATVHTAPGYDNIRDKRASHSNWHTTILNTPENHKPERNRQRRQAWGPWNSEDVNKRFQRQNNNDLGQNTNNNDKYFSNGEGFQNIYERPSSYDSKLEAPRDSNNFRSDFDRGPPPDKPWDENFGPRDQYNHGDFDRNRFGDRPPPRHSYEGKPPPHHIPPPLDDRFPPQSYQQPHHHGPHDHPPPPPPDDRFPPQSYHQRPPHHHGLHNHPPPPPDDRFRHESYHQLSHHRSHDHPPPDDRFPPRSFDKPPPHHHSHGPPPEEIGHLHHGRYYPPPSRDHDHNNSPPSDGKQDELHQSDSGKSSYDDIGLFTNQKPSETNKSNPNLFSLNETPVKNNDHDYDESETKIDVRSAVLEEIKVTTNRPDVVKSLNPVSVFFQVTPVTPEEE